MLEYKWEFGTIEHDNLNIFIFEESSVVFLERKKIVVRISSPFLKKYSTIGHCFEQQC